MAVTPERPSKLRTLGAMHDSDRDRLAFVRAVTQHLGEGVGAMDREGRLTFLNRAAETMLGWPEEALLGERIHDLVHHQRADGTPLPADECPMRDAISKGETVRIEDDVLTRRDGTMFPVSYICSPIYSGVDIVGAVLAFRDMTDYRREEQERERIFEAERAARQRLAFLAEASETLASSLDYSTTVTRVAHLAVPRIADWCAVDVLEADGSLHRVATAHVDPAKVQMALELAERYPTEPDPERGVYKVIRTGRTDVFPEIPEELIVQVAVDEEHLALIRSIGMRSVMLVPLTARGRTFGAITFVSAESGRNFGDDDVALAEDLARRTAVAIDNARLFGERMKVVDALQRSLLPPHLPKIAGVEVEARYHASGEANEVGGDFYDMFRTGRRGRWVVVMGDVCGKGAEAAAVTGLARYTIRAAAMQQRKPSKILGVLNEAIRRQGTDERFCTVALATLERTASGMNVTIACGGHPAPFVIRGDGSARQVKCSGTLLGIFGDPDLTDEPILLEPGDALVFFTDGVTESRGPGGEIYGTDRLGSLLSSCQNFSAAEIAERIEQAALRQGPPRDDIALLVLKNQP